MQDDVMINAETIQLAHGSGGRLSRELIQSEIVSRFGNGPLAGLPDAATLPFPGDRLVFTTDSYVVQPLEFPGGNIGDLAVHGTVNDLAVCGGKPKWLSLGLIIEEGLPINTLRRILDSVKKSAADCGITVVTGDTKVVGKGQSDGLYINTSGIGEMLPNFALSADSVVGGDDVIVSGNLGDHGFAVLAARKNINIVSNLRSDTAPIHRLIQASQPFATGIRFMRDPTRGGLAAVLNETVSGRTINVCLDEKDIPLSAGARALSETLGIDPLHVASEGRIVLFCSPAVSDGILNTWKTMPEGHGACKIGSVSPGKGRVTITTITGGYRIVDMPRGELLPRIC